MRSVAAAVAVAAVVAPLAAASPTAVEAARLAVLDRSPLVVRGIGFRAGEQVSVRVVVRGGVSATRTVRARPQGTWVARFRAIHLGHCGSFVVRATGARGTRGAYTEHLPPCGAAP